MVKLEDRSIVGTVVRSRAGRDRKRIFIVIGVTEAAEGMRLIVSDGRLRKLSFEKTKNPIHVEPIAHLSEEEMLLLEGADDEMLRRLVARYDRPGETVCM